MLKPGQWLMDEIINSSVVLLRMYVFQKSFEDTSYMWKGLVITDIDFSAFVIESR